MQAATRSNAFAVVVLSADDPMFIIPLLQSNYILYSTITGGIYFQEFEELSPLGIDLWEE